MNTFLVYNPVTGETMADSLSRDGADEAAGPFGHGAAVREMTAAEIAECDAAERRLLARNCRANSAGLLEVARSIRDMAERHMPGRARNRMISKAFEYERDAVEWRQRAEGAG